MVVPAKLSASRRSLSFCLCHRRTAFAIVVVVASAVLAAVATVATSWSASDGISGRRAAAAMPTLNATIAPPYLGKEAHSTNGTAKMKKCPRISDIVVCPGRKSVINGAAAETTIYCKDCIQEPMVDTFYAANANASSRDNNRGSHSGNNTETIYLPLLVPPYFGSSILSSILSSSPMVTNMCKDPYGGTDVPWQCEPTRTLVREGVFDSLDRWKPDKTNWTKAYEVYHRLEVWKDMDAPIRLDKAPPNLAKARQLVEYFESNGLDYRFIILMRHPCRTVWVHGAREFPTRYAVHLRNIARYVPEARRFFVNYDDLVTRPGQIMEALLDWFPLLTSLSIDSGELAGRAQKEQVEDRRRRLKKGGVHTGGSLRRYIESDVCTLKMRKGVDEVPAGEIELWEDHFAGG